MTKEVIVTMKGLQFIEEQDVEPVEVITRGEYYYRNGKHYVVFEEILQGVDAPTKNVLKFQEDSVEITKKGGVNVHMMFEVGRKNVTYYYTPYGSLLIGIEGKKITLLETGEKIELQVDYGMEVNYEFIADCSIFISITAPGAEDFHL